MKNKITEWWWGFFWGTCFAMPVYMAYGDTTELAAGIFIGTVFGSLAMRYSIIYRLRTM